jgi:pyridoxamine 5'-phosphate oxidase
MATMTEPPAATVDPLQTLADWLEEARHRGAPEHDAMALATATPSGEPAVRIVLCRGIDARGLRFFTNYQSRKGHEIEANPRGAVSFFWAVLDRQVRVEGDIERLSPAESDAYFRQRPRGHQLGAWTSAQSQPLASLEALRSESDRLDSTYEGRDIPRPPHWGGFLLRPTSVELWTRGAERLHDRVRYERHGADGPWLGTRLAP